MCINPPLDDEDELPAGEWLCNRCKILEQMDYEACLKEDTNEEYQKENSNSFFKENSPSPIESIESIEREDQLVCCQKAISNKQVEEAKSKEDEDEEEINEETMKNLTKSIDLLIKAASLANPKQFQLPIEYAPPINLPGSSRKSNAFSGQLNSNKSTKKQLYELENGLVALPVKTCFKCDKSCRKSCLMQCDYCPLLYHLDCLDPPLTCLPTTRWMCPNHVENVLEQKLLTSTGLSERVKLWNNFNEIHGETVKLNFIKKVSRKTAPYRVKLRIMPKNLVHVPESVKQMYKRPVNLIPSNNVFSADSKVIVEDSENVNKVKANEREQLEWLAGLTEFQNSIAIHLNKETEKSSDLAMADSMNEFLNLGQDQIKLLAWEKYKEKLLNLTTSKNQAQQQQLNNSSLKDDASIDTVSLPESFCLSKSSLKRKLNASNNDDGSVRAQLCPIIIENNLIKGSSVPMRKNCLRIGCDSSMELNLLNYGHCNYISEKHAFIFYDEDSKHFELINYSEFGTVVDKIKYSCDYLTKRTYTTNKFKDSSIVSTVKNLIKKSRREKIANSRLAVECKNQANKKNKHKLNNTDHLNEQLIQPTFLRDENQKLCYCDRKSLESSICGWEG